MSVKILFDNPSIPTSKGHEYPVSRQPAHLRGSFKFEDQHCLESLEQRVLLSVSLNADGWTVVGESVDTRVIYVSSSTGSDSNSGFSESDAVASLEKAKDLVRDGKPDWILLKKGDVWTESFTSSWDKSGRSADEPILISSYGNGDRPEIRTGAGKILTSKFEEQISHIAIIGIHFNAHTRNPDSASFTGTAGSDGIRWLSDGENLLIENNIFEFYETNLVIQSSHGYSNVQIRRNVITDAYDVNGLSHGLFAKNLNGLRLEGNVFDHNGWHEDYPDTRSIFNHNVYVQVDVEGLTATNNFFLRGSSHGLQARNGGVVTNNVFAYNALGLSYGYVLGGAEDDAPPGGVVGRVSDNIFLQGQDIGNSPRGIALELGNIEDARVFNNVFAHSGGVVTSTIAMQVDSTNLEGINNLKIQNNVVYNWYRGIKFDGSDKTASNIEITGNEFHDTESTLPLIDLNVSDLPSALNFSGNRYYQTENSKPFRTDDGRMSFSDWKTYSGENDAVYGQTTAPHPERELDDYDAFAGGPGTLNSFYSNIRQFGNLEPGIAYTAGSVVNYLQAGYIDGITESTAGKPPSDDSGDNGTGGDNTSQTGNADYLSALQNVTNAFNNGDSITNWHIGIISDRASGKLRIDDDVLTAYDFDLADNSEVTMRVKELGQDGAVLLMNEDFQPVVSFERNNDGDFAYDGELGKGTYYLLIFNSDSNKSEVRFRALTENNSGAVTPDVLSNPLGSTDSDTNNDSGNTDSGNTGGGSTVVLEPEKDLGSFSSKRWTNGRLTDGDQSDVFKFQLGVNGNIELLVRYLRDDADVRLFDADGNLIASSTNSGDRDERLTASLTKDTYYVEVYSDKTNVDTSYGLGILVS